MSGIAHPFAGIGKVIDSVAVLSDRKPALSSEPRETIIGCDFGASARAGEQAKKIILIEATRRNDGTYVVGPSGRNTRLVRKLGGSSWRERRRGWTVVELAQSLGLDSDVSVAAFDFPFSIPAELLNDDSLADRIGCSAFRTRNRWAKFVASQLPLEFDSDRANGKLPGLEKFDVWKSQEFWIKRATDFAARSQPSLKHLYQSTFAMTLVGCSLLSAIDKNDCQTVLEPREFATGSRFAIEAYPGAAARSVGFTGPYKRGPREVLEAALAWLDECGIRIEFDRRVRRFCETYCSAPNDFDGVDAFLCLVTAIAFREGWVTFLSGAASKVKLRQEGCIVVPRQTEA